MKITIKISTVLIFLTSFLAAKANPIKPTAKTITVSYHKSCFIGCGTIDVTRQHVNFTYLDGSTEQIVYRTVNCRGIGFKGCPSKFSSIEGENNNDTWIDNSSGEMFDHAINQMENEVTSGTYRKTYRNIETGQTLVFEVVWSYTEISEGEWEQSIEVAIIQ